MTRREIERRLTALEEDANPEICTWVDLMNAVDEGRENLVLSPAMQDLFDSALSGRVP
ncbi:hypothetical protein [Methanoculleus sp.]|jgi:hypothetical protein|uniref:hypothetical protein n=1 Tax=Methanoculleus sp. TaxID=90427 RepID=UPI001BD547CE|nr:hypothetical protein [Methanoculleus sp.]